LVTPFACAINLRTEIAPYSDNKKDSNSEFDRRTFTSVKLGSIIVKVSMDDLYILNSIVSELSKRSKEISELWSDYAKRGNDPRLAGIDEAL
jgi:hypothetical protein